MTVLTGTLSDFSTTVATAWTWARRILWAGAAILALFFVLEAIHLHGLLERIHPAVAWTVTLSLAALLLYGGGLAAWRYFKVPRVVAPPELPEPEVGWTPAQQQAYRQFAVRYLRRLDRNPHLDDAARTSVAEAIVAVEAWSPPADADAVAAARALSSDVQNHLGRALAPLDETARRLIRRTAVEVSIATAVSPSILLDSLITLSRNVNMISRLADLYYGRPGLFGTLRIVRDVIGSAVAAGALEVVTDNLTSAASEITGSWSSRLLGPLGQGAVNGVVTMRLGAAARLRCRALATRRVPWRPWRAEDYRRGFARLMEWLSEDVGPRFTQPLARWLSWTAGSGDDPADPAAAAGDDLADGPDAGRPRWWNRVFSRREREPETAEAAPARKGDRSSGKTPEGDDPLLDGDFFG